MQLITVLGVILFFALLVLTLSPRKRNFLGTCESLVNKLPPNQYARLCDYIDPDPDGSNDCKFWEESGGIYGLIERLRTSLIFVQLVQVHYRDGRISAHDARYIWNRIALQMLFTLRSASEAMWCCVFCSLPHINAKSALRFYCEIVLRANTLCAQPDSPACMLKLNQLL